MIKLLLFTALIFFTGCLTPYSQSPIAVNFKTTEQPKLQAAAHWNIIAKDISKELTTYRKTPIYIESSNQKTTFDNLFVKMLKSSMVQRGATIVTDKKYAKAVMRVDTKKVYFTRKLTHPRRVGVLAGLGAGVFLLRNANAGQIAAASVLALEGVNYYESRFDSIPHSELVIHIDIFDDKKVLDSLTKVYYVVDKDSRLYTVKKPKKLPPVIEIEG